MTTSNDKLPMHTPNLVDANIAKLAELFPNVMTEQPILDDNGEPKTDKDGNTLLKPAIDFELLKQELSQQVVDGSQERYRLDWVGKRKAILEANSPIAKTLRPVRSESVDFDNTENLFIEGDNLDALKLLQESYLGKVKMIYIDPPYNTGNDFIYEDDFAENTEDFLQRSNQKDEDGNRLVANTESNGRFHSDWLTMMYSRLKLARNLLSDDGVIFISCDDNEVHNLHKICDEVFGSDNFINTLSIEINPKGRKNSKFISVSNDFCLIYAKNSNKSYFIENIPKNIKDMTLDENGNYIHNSGKRVLVGENSSNKFVVNLDSDKHYSVYYNEEKKELKILKEIVITEINKNLIQSGYNRFISCRDKKFIENTYTPQKLKSLFNDGALDFKQDKIFEKNLSSKIRLKSIVINQEYNALINNKSSKYKLDIKTTSAGTELKTIFNSDKPLFTAPKNKGLIKLFSSLFDSVDFICLDFFAGSATTAHAAMDLNAQDGGKRKFIMVQLPEVTDEKSEAHKAGYSTIAEISKERIRRAGKKILEDNKDKEGINQLDIGFRVLKIDDTNMKEVYYTPDKYSQDVVAQMESNIKDDRTAEDLLFQVMLDWGIPLDLPITNQTIANQTIYSVDGNSLVACFDFINTDMIDEIAKLKPLKFVSCERAIQKDEDKSNIKERFKQLSSDTQVKFI